MLKRIVVAAFALFASVSVSVADTPAVPSSISSLASNPLVSSLTGPLGLNTAQAAGGAGAMLGLAQAKLPKADWGKISTMIPGSSTLISRRSSTA